VNADIRIKTTWPGHLKTKRLLRRLGHAGAHSLICLWCYAAINRPKGVLHGMSREAIATAAEWEGDPTLFVDALIEIGWIDDNGTDLELHDWEQHNKWCYYAEERSLTAQKNIQKRWGKKRKVKPKNTSGIQPEYKGDTNGNTPLPLPSPFPSPSLKEMIAIFWDIYPFRNGIKQGKVETLIAIEKNVKPDEYKLLLKATDNFANSPDAKNGIGVKDPQRFILSGKEKSKVEPWREWITVEKKQSTLFESNELLDSIKKAEAERKATQ
jgi:hypothetical protein